jgi:hypothetical protein
MMTDDAERQFTEWFAKNYPGPDTIIYDPLWHAPKILRAARAAMSSRADRPEPATGAVYGGKDSSDALFNACMTREIDPTGTPKEVIDRIIDWEISLERADGGKDSSDARDAERYRWLREQDDSGPLFVMYGSNGTWGECGHSDIYGELLDESIDEEIAKEAKK